MYKYKPITDAVAGGAATSPFWLSAVDTAMDMIAHPFWTDLLPFSGVAWICMQAFFLAKEKYYEKRRANDVSKK